MGALSGFKIVEMAGIGPGPFCAMMLADMGAEVIRIDRTVPADLGLKREPRQTVLHRGRRSLALDMKNPLAAETVLQLVEQADGLIEGFRPGVAERLGIGPDVCLARNKKLIYGRMTGWGQDGPYAATAGHDLNYIALTGALDAIGPKDGGPVPPLNLVGDFGGGGMYLAFGMVAGMLEASRSSQGQVVDAAMVEGASLLMASLYGAHGAGAWNPERGTNVLDGGAHNYGCYECADGNYISIGSLEHKFHRELYRLTGLDEADVPGQMARERWPELKEKFTKIFKTKSRQEWCEIMEGSDVCFAPVLNMDEAPNHPHNVARKNFIELAGITQPAPGPRFSRTPAATPTIPPLPGEHSEAVLADWGFGAEAIAALKASGAMV